MNTTSAQREVATKARARFRAIDFAGAAEEQAIVITKILTQVRFNKASASVAASLLWRIQDAGATWMPSQMFIALDETATALVTA